MDKAENTHSCDRNFVCICPVISREMKRMSAELMIKTGIMCELQTELNEKQQHFVRF